MTRLESLVMPAGISPEVPALQQTVRTAPGDLLVIYSDGVPEATATHEEEFGERRLLHVVQQNRSLAASELCLAILDSVKHFGQGGHAADDLTVVAAKFHQG
jgi:sigma-B regulation protein RsbU (phosphoserine phosphatase)